MRPITILFLLISTLSLFTATSFWLAQETPKHSKEERASLITRRDALAQQARTSAEQGDFDGAQKLFDRVFDIERSIFGDTHAELLGTLDYQSQVASAAQDWEGAIEYRRRAYEMGQRLYPRGGYQVRDLELALEEARNDAQRTDEQRRLLSQSTDTNREVFALYRQGKHAEAIGPAKRVVKVREKVLGKKHPDYATSLNNLARLCYSMGDYARAEPLYAEAKAVREKVLGKEHPDYATSLNNLARLCYSMGDYARAEPLYAEAKAVREKVLGKEHPDYATSLNNLAALYDSLGDYARAEPLYVEAQTIYEKVLGKQHPDYATSLNNLALLYQSMGDYARAEPLYVEAQTIREKVLGKEHPDYATSLNSLAGLCESIGDYARAEPLYVEAKTIYEKVLGKQHPDYATSLNNLAALYESIGDYARAEPLYVEANTIHEKVLGKQHPDYAASLNNLAALYELIGDYARAEPLYVEANTIHEKVLGKQHPDYAASLNNLAALYESIGDYARAEPLYVEAKTIWAKTIGKEHPDYATSLNNLALLYQSMGDHVLAEPFFQQAVEITLKHLEETAYVQSEQQQMLMSQSVRHMLDSYLSCCVEGNLKADNAIEQLIVWKGSILRRGRDLRLAASDPAIGEQFGQLQSVASQLSASLRSIPTPDKMDAWKKRTATLTQEKRQLEAELSRRSAAFRDAVQPINFASIRDSIPAGAVLIDYLEYVSEEGRFLVASIIRREGELELLDLGSAEKAGQAIDAWRKSFGMTAEAKAAGADLRRQLWEPLLDHLQDTELILVSTDGVLGRLPFAALPGKQPNTHLIEDHRLALIPVPQLLPALVGRRESQTSGHETLLVGDVDYGQSNAEESWPRLAETGREIDFIKQLVTRTAQADDDSLNELRAEEATETAIRDLAPKAQLLHLATHGFFASADKKNALAPSAIAQSRGSASRLLNISGAEREVVVGYSPGQLSGLVFAGANRAAESINKFSGHHPVDDGIMTADEIAFLPLERTELAVLSACETGLGEVAGGEGLIGIQRAFQVAGADSVVATMWKVDDVMTRKLMERFYRNLFDEKLSKLDALRDAQLWILHHPSIVTQAGGDRGSVRRKKQSSEPAATKSPKTDPYYWAPFVLSGDWR